MSTALIPDTAPFSDEQRAWLNGFFSALFGAPTFAASVGDDGAAAGFASTVLGSGTGATAEWADDVDEDFPWHDPALDIDERLKLANGKPLERKMMAAMAQLDCGSCGYTCQTYAEAVASGDEKNLTLCSPGGKETSKWLKKLAKEAGLVSIGVSSQVASPASPAGYSRTHPFAAPLVESRRLNRSGSAKDTRHVVFDLAGSGIHYEAGDALGVYPTNCDELVDQVVLAAGADATAEVASPLGNIKRLRDALLEDCCLRDPSDELLELLRAGCNDSAVAGRFDHMIDNGTDEGFDVLDALQLAEGVKLSAEELVAVLGPLNPRLYSIASSQKKVGAQVHLTVGRVGFERGGRSRKGVASSMLAERVSIGGPVRIFVQRNHGGFTVPADTTAPMIMVGPGTGIAPFIAFLQEREMAAASGANWLFFGDQRAAHDFLYEDELRKYKQSGLLTRLDTAFSRDGGQKVYVQDRMRENASELWAWLRRGAHFYVCGDASRMAADVDRALHEIVGAEGVMDESAAKAFIQEMVAGGRYVRDVY